MALAQVVCVSYDEIHVFIQYSSYLVSRNIVQV